MTCVMMGTDPCEEIRRLTQGMLQKEGAEKGTAFIANRAFMGVKGLEHV